MWRGWRDVLARRGFDSAALDAKLLAGHALGLGNLELALREHELVDAEAVERVAELLRRRIKGESVARIVGEREFYGLAFALNAATLEPRPETELLVDMALGALPPGGHMLDLGTGSGCIPIAVLANRPDAKAVAVDLNGLALEAARQNAERHGVTARLEFRQGNWFEPLSDKGSLGGPPVRTLFDLIVSNPPYITSAVVDTLEPEVRDFDPRLALDGGPDGLAPYRVIAAGAAAWLKADGQIMVEIGHDQGSAVSQLFIEAGLKGVTVNCDLNGLDRVVSAYHVQCSHPHG